MPGKSHGERSLAGYSPWGRKESDMTERLSIQASTVKKPLNCINSSLPLIFHLYGPACYFWLHRFFTMEGPPVYIAFPEVYNGVFQLQSHHFEPILCPISWANESDELNYGRAVFGTVCLSWQVTHLPSKVWFLWPQIPQARRNSQITQKVSRGSLWGVLWFLTHPTSWDHLLSKLPFLLLWTLESFESLMPTSYVFTYLQRYLQLHVLNSVKLGRLFEPGMRMRWEGKCQFTI